MSIETLVAALVTGVAIGGLYGFVLRRPGTNAPLMLAAAVAAALFGAWLLPMLGVTMGADEQPIASAVLDGAVVSMVVMVVMRRFPANRS